MKQLNEWQKKDLKYIIGILNSRFMSRFYQIYFNSLSLAGGFYRIGAPQIKELPIPNVDQEKEKTIVNFILKKPPRSGKASNKRYYCHIEYRAHTYA